MSVRWYSEDPRSGEQIDYNQADTKTLEASYQGRKQAINLTISGMRFTIDVKNMTQSNNSGGSRKVKRVQLGGAAKSSGPVDSEVAAFWAKAANGEHELLADGFANLFGPLGVNAENADCFIFVYLLKCKGCWKITKDDFEQGMSNAGIKPTTKAVSGAIDSAKKSFQRDSNEFIQFLGFCWSFSRNSPNATIIPTDEGTPILELAFTVAPKTLYPLADMIDYLNAKVKAISSDLWKQVGKFVVETKKDLSNYDEMACWNSVIDDFVEAKKEQ